MIYAYPVNYIQCVQVKWLARQELVCLIKLVEMIEIASCLVIILFSTFVAHHNIILIFLMHLASSAELNYDIYNPVCAKKLIFQILQHTIMKCSISLKQKR
uniref:Uncharacterized protein n=1 Tax=Kalanchoe fedtschenkoi TaxID=63787 RepID=A0A7N0RET0_KALFE